MVAMGLSSDGNSFLVADDIGKIYFYSIPDVPKWKKLPKEQVFESLPSLGGVWFLSISISSGFQFYLGDYRDNVSTIDEELFDEVSFIVLGFLL